MKVDAVTGEALAAASKAGEHRMKPLLSTQTHRLWSNYSELTVSSLLKYEVVISEHVGFSAHGRPERGESAGKTHNPRGRRPPGRRRRVMGFVMRFRSALAGHAVAILAQAILAQV